MAQAIAGVDAKPGLIELARRVVEAQLDLIRVKEARRLVLEDPNARRKRFNIREVTRGVREFMRWGDRMAAQAANQFERDEAIDEAYEKMERLIEERAHQGEPPSLEEGFWRLTPQLIRLDRYERRATSRRNRAMRMLAARRAALEGGPEENNE